MDKVNVIVLAAGHSNRFNHPKALLLFDREKTFLEKILYEYLKFGCAEPVVVLNEITLQSMEVKLIERIKGVSKIIINDHPEYGRFYSLQSGCKEVSEDDFCFMQNVDNPFVNPDILEQVYNERSPSGYVVPIFNDKGGHPVLLSRVIMDKINKETNLETNIKDFLKQFHRTECRMENDFVLANINTPEDYEKYLGKSCEAHIRGNIIHL